MQESPERSVPDVDVSDPGTVATEVRKVPDGDRPKRSGPLAGVPRWIFAVGALVVVGLVVVVAALLGAFDADEPVADGASEEQQGVTLLEPGLEAWCASFTTSVTLIQTFTVFPSTALAGELGTQLDQLVAVAPEEIKGPSEILAREYGALADTVETGDQAAVEAKATEMAANPALKAAIGEDLPKFYKANCPQATAPVPGEEAPSETPAG